jgi:hypothetical protein
MKTRKIFSKVIMGLFLLFTLSLTSCEPLAYIFNCKTCTSGDGKDKQQACGDHDQEVLESQGYTCK